MSLDSYSLIIHFYIIEALKTRVDSRAKFGMKSQEKLIEDLTTYQNELVETTTRRLYDYNAMAIYGELRHMRYQTNEKFRIDGVPVKGSRYSSYDEATDYTPMSIFNTAERAFKELTWEEGFGGDMWGFIANRAQLHDKIPNKIFCDMCFSLSHNSSPYLDKEETDIFKISEKIDYVQVLDDKFKENLEYLIYRYFFKIGNRLYKLIKRAFVLGFINFDGYCFGSELLELLNNKKNISYCYRKDSVSDFRIRENSREEKDMFVYTSIDWGIERIKPVYYNCDDKIVSEWEKYNYRRRRGINSIDGFGYGHLVVVTNGDSENYCDVGVIKSIQLYTGLISVEFNFNDSISTFKSYELSFANEYFIKGMLVDVDMNGKYINDALIFDYDWGDGKTNNVTLSVCSQEEDNELHTMSGLLNCNCGWYTYSSYLYKINLDEVHYDKFDMPCSSNKSIKKIDNLIKKEKKIADSHKYISLEDLLSTTVVDKKVE